MAAMYDLAGDVVFPPVPKDAPPDIQDEVRRCRQLYYNYSDAYMAYARCVQDLTAKINEWKSGRRRMPSSGAAESPFGRLAPRPAPMPTRRTTLPFGWGMFT